MILSMATSKVEGEPGADDVGRWREIAFERIHRWGALVAIIVSVLVGLGGGIDVATTLAVCTVMMVPLLYALRSRVSPRARAASFAVAMFVVAIVNFALVGFSPNFPLVFVLSAVAVAIWFGPRAAVGVALGSVAIVWAAAIYRVTTHWEPPMHGLLHGSPVNLFRMALAYTVLILLVVASIAYAIATIDRHARERATAEAARRAAEQALVESQKLELVGRIASGVAHDFNNALTIILAWADILRSDRRDATVGLDAIRQAALSSAQMTRRLLVFARHGAPEKKPLFLEHHLAETARTLGRVLPENIAVVVACDDVPPIAADPGALDQAILNLALNARDAMPDGGTLTLGAVRGDGAWVGVRVVDTGVGMDAATQTRLFEPFFTTKGNRGTGLGLTSVRTVTHELGGRVEVTSAPDRGTTFTLWLPAAARAALPTETPRGTPIVRTATILLVEDDPALRQVMAAALRSVGHEVLEAGTVDAGLEIARRMRGELGLLCTDGIVPGGSVRRLVEGFRELYPAAPVLLCSGYLAPDVPSAEDLGASSLAKPFEASALLARVGELLAERPAAAAS
jgi:signal transduction histidine kinase/ActR/RegA family two-component response regulator